MHEHICSVDDCGRPVIARGWCTLHYQRWQKHGDPLTVHRPPERCSVDGCERPHSGYGWCSMHYTRMRNHGELGPAESLRWKNIGECDVECCSEPAKRRGLCAKHYRRWYKLEGSSLAGPTVVTHQHDLTRFWAKVAAGPVPTYAPALGPCWLWAGSVDRDDYGKFAVTTTTGRVRHCRAHRWAYEARVGPIPEGLTLDHLCRVRRCVRPSHLEPVMSAVNTMRGQGPAASNAAKTHCKRRHEFTPGNTYHKQQPSGSMTRACKECGRQRSREHQRAKRRHEQRAVHP